MAEIDRLWDEIHGNQSLKSFLRTDIEAGRLAHAYILEGGKGSGKTMLALTVCAALSGDEDRVSVIFSGNCPDVLTVRRREDRKTIGVDEIRAMRSSAYVRPNDLEFKAYLLEECETMTVQAQNALLKLLEEPPQNVYFFLMCENASALLPTVRSRAPTLRMQSFEKDQLSEYLISAEPKLRLLANGQPAEFAALIDAAGGSIGMAKDLFERRSEKKSDLRDDVPAFLDTILSGGSKEIYLACLGLPSKREELSEFCRQARVALRDLAAIRAMKNPELLFGAEDRLRSMARRVSVGKILRIEAEFADKEEALAANINLQNARISLAAKLVASD